MTEQMRKKIEETIAECLRAKFRSYTPKDNYMPFHHRLLGKDRYAIYSFLHSLNTSFGSSIFEHVAVTLAQDRFSFAARSHIVGDEINLSSSNAIEKIMHDLEIGIRRPNRTEELEILRQCGSSEKRKCKPTIADLYFIDKKGTRYLFDMKSPKPNIGEFKGFKRTLLTWSAIALAEEPTVSVKALIAFTYNPHYPEAFKSWQMRGMLESDEFLVEKGFWDFVGGEGAFEKLLLCFEKVGVAMRGEIDEYFKRFS